MPAPDGQGDQGDRTGLRGVGRWGELWVPKEEGARRGHLLGSAQPHPLRKPLPPWPVGWDPPGPEGQLRRALSPEMGGPQSSPRTSPGVSCSWNEGCPSVPKSLGHLKSCWAGGATEMPPKISPPLPPNSCWLDAAGLLPLNQLPARLAPAHQDAGSHGLLSLLPPCSWCPMPTVGLGWGRVTPVPWCQLGRPRPLRPTESPRPCSQAIASRGSACVSPAHGEPRSCGQPDQRLLTAPQAEVGAGSPSAPRRQPPAFPLPKDLLGHQSPRNSREPQCPQPAREWGGAGACPLIPIKEGTSLEGRGQGGSRWGPSVLPLSGAAGQGVGICWVGP
ncbi:vegetative cell wall protein gp1-like [Pteropus medius]|uniref:vegetative cell wall protein gp1-like n=1 Tax=Pteropus vampyrus TaxID=132908 RepID=UPI00196AC678|nr:vegetative cell wall protein gp1-like [Pteropus giganteus]